MTIQAAWDTSTCFFSRGNQNVRRDTEDFNLDTVFCTPCKPPTTSRFKFAVGIFRFARVQCLQRHARHTQNKMRCRITINNCWNTVLLSLSARLYVFFLVGVLWGRKIVRTQQTVSLRFCWEIFSPHYN